VNREEQVLRDEISLREASLQDAKRERDAGELSLGDFDQIVAREEKAIAKALEKISALKDVAPKVAVRRVRKKRLLVVAIVAFSAATVLILWSALAPRQQGTSITGSVQLTAGCSRLMQKM